MKLVTVVIPLIERNVLMSSLWKEIPSRLKLKEQILRVNSESLEEDGCMEFIQEVFEFIDAGEYEIGEVDVWE